MSSKTSEPEFSFEAMSTKSFIPGERLNSSETLYEACEDVFLVYLDFVGGSSISSSDFSLFRTLTRNFETRFLEDMRFLNVLDPDELTRATSYIPEIIQFIEKIIDNGFAYSTSDGSIYFNIDKFANAGNHYAKLEPWNRHNKHLQRDGEGSLSKNTTAKASKNDFALWNASRAGEPSWPGPWGNGRPGWHIECSAMASATLGSQIDIHSGGIDLAFPHHDNELPQGEAYWGETQWVNYFLHMGHLSIHGSKMSKSLKNFTAIGGALAKGTWTSRSVRIVFLLGRWREGIEITTDMVNAARSWEAKLDNFFLKARNIAVLQKTIPEEQSDNDDSLTRHLISAQEKVFIALCSSFDTPAAMNAISELVSNYNSIEPLELNCIVFSGGC